MHALNEAVGFVPEREIEKPEKQRAAELLHPRAVRRRGTEVGPPYDPRPTPWPTSPPSAGPRPTASSIRKALAEFAHERLITPEAQGKDGEYAVRSDDGADPYRFTARRRALDHWQVDAESITRHRDGAELPLAALDFFIELKKSLGLSDEVLPVYLEEISSTLSGTCFKLTKPQIPVRRAREERLPGRSRPA